MVSDELKELKKSVAAINKQIAKMFPEEGETPITTLSADPLKIKRFSTSSLVIDDVIGGGIPEGRVIEIYGPEASGKTSVSLSIAGNVQKEGGVVGYIDLENAMDPTYAEILGVKLEDLIFTQPASAEAALEMVKFMIQSEQFKLVVVDSIGAMVTRAESEGVSGDVKVAPLARLLSQQMKIIATLASKHNTAVIFINQQRANIGGFSAYGPATTTMGGAALKYAASLRLEVKRLEYIKEGSGDKAKTVGTRIRVKSVKNKTAPPMKQGETVISNTRGIDPRAEIIAIGESIGILERPTPRKWVEAETGEIIGTSKAEAEERIYNDTELQDRLIAAANRAFAGEKVSSVESNDENLLDEDNLNEDL